MKRCCYDTDVAETSYKVIKTKFIKNQIFETQIQLGYASADYVNSHNNLVFTLQ